MKTLFTNPRTPNNSLEAMGGMNRNIATMMQGADLWSYHEALMEILEGSELKMVALENLNIALLPAAKWTFRPTKGADNATYLGMPAAVFSYLELKSIVLTETREYIGVQWVDKLSELIKELGLDPKTVGVYVGGFEDYKKYFLSSDFLNSTRPCRANVSMENYMLEPFIQGIMFQLDWNNIISDTGIVLFDDNADAVGNIEKENVIDFLNTPIYEMTWDLLTWTHSIIEVSPDLTLLIDFKIPQFETISELAQVLEVVEPMAPIASLIEEDRANAIQILRYSEYLIMNILANIKHSEMKYLFEESYSKIKILNDQISNAPNETKEFTNGYTW